MRFLIFPCYIYIYIVTCWLVDGFSYEHWYVISCGIIVHLLIRYLDCPEIYMVKLVHDRSHVGF